MLDPAGDPDVPPPGDPDVPPPDDPDVPPPADPDVPPPDVPPPGDPDVPPLDEPVDGPPAAFEHMSISFLDCPLGQRLVVPVQDSAKKPTLSLQQFTPPEYA